MLVLPKQKTGSPLGHSADVILLLHCDGRTLSLSHTSNNSLRLAEHATVPLGPARVEIITDGVSFYSEVIITGRRPESLWLEIAG
jgi:hypothetical protein